jgi:hypothetical protein
LSRRQSYEEVRDEDFNVMGAELGPIFTQLRQEVAWIQVLWHEYLELYGTSPQRLELLNESGKLFFLIVQKSMWNDILLRICRITDRASMRSRENLTLLRLPELVVSLDSEIVAEITNLVAKAEAASVFAREWRNKKIAHADLEVSLGQAVTPLPEASRNHVSTAITALHEVLNSVSLAFRMGAMHPEPIIGADGALSVLYVIRDGLEADRALRQRIHAGTYTSDDIKPRPSI